MDELGWRATGEEHGERVVVRRARELDGSLALLGAIDVSSPAIDALQATALAAGARGAKLTGAGGGGCLLVLPPPDPAPLIAAFKIYQPLAVEVTS